ncbi:MAG: hypothetical protein EAZ97_06240, partial [Bacteroidetes bacterium]
EFILTLEQQIKDLTFEVGIALDEEKNVKIVKEGVLNKVVFSEEERKSILASILTHNHPSQTPHSEIDLVFAYEHDLKEIRVVISEKIYVIKPNSEGWKSPVEVGRLFNEIWVEIVNSVQKGLISHEQALEKRNHIGLTIAQKLNYQIQIIEI